MLSSNITLITVKGTVKQMSNIEGNRKTKTIKVVRDPCQKITLLLLKSKSVRVIVPESCF